MTEHHCMSEETIRRIIKEELAAFIMIVLDAKTTATAIEKGQFYSDGSFPYPEVFGRKE